MYNLKCYSLSGTPTPIFSIFCRSYMRCCSRWCGLDCCNHYNCLQNEVIFKVSFNIWQYNSHCFELIQTCKIKQISSAIYTLTDHNIQIYIIYPVNLYQLNTRKTIERHLGFGFELRKPKLPLGSTTSPRVYNLSISIIISHIR